MKRENPFKTGKIVTGEGYIGRDELFMEITDSILMSDRSPNYSLRGLTRMGKTSLAKKIIKEVNRHNNENIVTVFYSLAIAKSFSEFLRGIVHSIYNAFKKANHLNEEIQEQFSSFEEWIDAEKTLASTFFLKESLYSFFEAIDETGVKTVIFIDEFDNAIVAFENDATNFQIFRNIIMGEYNVSCVLTNRLPIKEIDNSLPAGSTLGGVINERKIIGFSSREMDKYFELIKKCGVTLNKKQKEDIIKYGGNSPFILSLLGHEILNSNESELDDKKCIDKIYNNKLKLDIRKYFDSLITHMKQEKLYSPIIQMFIGPRTTINKDDINKLLEFGYIYDDKNRMEEFIDSITGEPFLYQTLSVDFIDYLRNTLEPINDKTWSIIISTEQILRRIIEDTLINIYKPENWQYKLKEEAKSNGYFSVKQAENFLKNGKENFPDTFNENILSVISFNALSNIIEYYWESNFEKIFNPPYKEIEKLKEVLSYLNNIRNPLAHGSENCLTNDMRFLVIDYCEEIQKTIKNNKQK